MIYLTAPLALEVADQQALQAIQQQVNNEIDYSTRVSQANQRWKTKPVALFQRVRTALESTCPGARRCGYCEDSLADEIEHIRPKSWFPELSFDPNNYLFACGPCNGPKNNSYAVVDATGVLTEAIRSIHQAVEPPPAGKEALLHPRHDNAIDYFFLDLENTFQFKPHLTLDTQQKVRAEYTLKVLRINKDPLCVARKEAFYDFVSRMKSYYLAMKSDESLNNLTRYRSELLQKQHISVWREMQRQSISLPFLRELFALVPTAISW
ncbi:aminoglycoside phosphotransferase [Pontibacter sp. Tf4]|uniref:aminoglycoside phosphotransferase n=1 Tax=Pontibacter sp. Tf4 TaxID=2761620 RepID=UPI001627A713|nr:aminoglycoside phosphotransferase [Pontibacter sp. Tf4]MBB6609691.1 aminoglycoside phosphotransferase [Pontibacter sp. Tf4]